MKASSYQFGDGGTAAERLQLLAEVYRDSSATFLTGAVQDPPEIALDLRCGPGLTTALLSTCTGARRTVGLDSSAEFVAQAKTTHGPELEFLQHDVTRVPFPVQPVNLVYCRFLLSHLAHPGEAVAAWSTQVHPGGLILLEEVESIRTEEEVLQRYLGFVAELLASQGQDLYVGRRLGAAQPPGNTEITSSVVTSVPVPAHQAARMFRLNLPQLRERQWAKEHRDEAWFEDLARELDSLCRPGAGEPVVWRLRQHVLRRSG
ncbi:class I SAM-dependent methyltransferase [Candidatus Latescibacterota bacterium]